MLRPSVTAVFLLAACSPAAPPLLIDAADQPATLIGEEPPKPVELVRATVEAEAQRLYGDECGTVRVPPRALVPVELTGGGHMEYAVFFGRVMCVGDGGSGRWQGTGGTMVQFWLASGGAPRMLLEHSMHGFSVTGTGLQSMQHGGYCPGGAGPGMCLVDYQWNERDRTLEVVGRRLFDFEHPGEPPVMQWSYEAISR